MGTITFDTYDFIQDLQKAGIPESQAKALADGFKKVDLEGIATKQDLANLRESLRVEIRDIKISLLMWIVPLLLGQTALFAAIVKWL